MSTSSSLDNKIVALEAEIEEYRERMRNASEEMMSHWLQLITASRYTLAELIKDRRAADKGSENFDCPT
jgi:predicted  nucleic acid-binding Zn-ribbon protein